MIEVVVALGIFALGIAAAIALMGPLQHAATDNEAADRAATLGPAVQNELIRLRDHQPAVAADARLDQMAASYWPEENSALELVGSRDGTQAVLADLVDNSSTASPPGIPETERAYLIVVRRQLAPLDYRPKAGFLALSVRILWPYKLALTHPEQASILILNTALTP